MKQTEPKTWPKQTKLPALVAGLVKTARRVVYSGEQGNTSTVCDLQAVQYVVFICLCQPYHPHLLSLKLQTSFVASPPVQT